MMLSAPLRILVTLAICGATAVVGIAWPTTSREGAMEDASMPTQAPEGWQRLFSEDFDRDSALGDFRRDYPGWAAYDGSDDTSHTTARPVARRGLWTSSTTTTVHDSVWDCRVHTRGNRPQVCTMTPTPDGEWWDGQRYGRYTVRFRADAVEGYKIAFLLWPSTNEWSDGEIDFPEATLTETVSAASHDVTGDPERNAFLVDTGVPVRGWHTAVIERSPAGLRFELDGKTWSTAEPDALPTKNMFWALQVETDLVHQAPPRDAEGHVVIDWVTIDSWRG